MTVVARPPPDPDSDLLRPSCAKKAFVCSEPSCGKSFARREHLHRHQFNHKDGNFTCHRCAAHFRRHDLLKRHAQRHQQKDDEAGGEGLGYLATRKRLWRDSDGRVINSSRPHKIVASTSFFDGRAERHGHKAVKAITSALPSPPTSNTSNGLDQLSDEHQAEVTYLQNPWPPIDISFMPQPEGTGVDFMSDSGWANQSFEALIRAPCDLPDTDVSFPDTTISFSTPLPTLQYYSWLFGNDFANIDTNHIQPLPSGISKVGLTNSRIQDCLQAGISGEVLRSPPLQPQLVQQNLLGVSNPNNLVRNESSRSRPPDSALGNTDMNSSTARRSPIPDSMPSYLSSSNHERTSELGMIGLDSNSLSFSSNRSSNVFSTTSPSFVNAQGLPPPDSYVRQRPLRLPIVTSEARDGLMQLISQSRPTRPDKSEITSCDPLLSLSSLQQYSDLFFTRFNSTYPLIHPGTFQSSNVHPLYLMAIVLLGATYSDKNAHLLAVCIHDIMRPLIHSNKEFGPRPKLWMLQTILLVECFGKSRAGERQHDMSNIYHGLQINLLRRSDCHNVHIPPWDETTQTLEEYWHMAIEAEQKRRLAMISFMWDTQHALFFAQILCMNASELKVTLPWDTAIWEADTAEEWLHLTRNSAAAPHYLSVLQMYTDPSVSSAPPHLNALSRVLVLHGLMSLSWDFRRRDQTALNRTNTSTTARWQSKISACYTKWKEDFDRYTKDVMSSLSKDPVQCAKFQRFAVANSAVYHIAELILEVETADLQIHAGAKHILGRPVTDLDRQRSRSRLQDFMERDEGKSIGRATWHAARLLRDGVRKLDNWDVDEMIYFPWCLYLATLTCWTIHSIAIENSMGEPPNPLYIPAPQGDGEVDEDNEWDSRTDMKALISALTRLDPARHTFAKEVLLVAERCRPHGLLACMMKHFSMVRWAVIREGMIVLKDLMNYERSSSKI